MLNTLPLADEGFVRNGYIRVYQDIRGKYGSEGGYVTTRPVVGPLNDSKVDHTTDAYDTIDWLVNKANLPESNGKVGMIGSSYEGFTVVMALLNPHPALKVAAPQSPMIDGWMGDDWFHYGAFRLANIAWLGGQTGYKGEGKAPPTGGYDDYDNFREIGSAGEWAKKSGYDQLPYWNRMSGHPAYDSFWSGQALDTLIAKNPSNVPTIWEQGLWDQEDMWGAIHSYEALKAVGKTGNNFIVMGPWRHSQINRTGSELGPFKWNGDTALQYREDMILPFFNQYLKDGPAVTRARGDDLQYRREPLGPLQRVAAGVRAGLPVAADAAVPRRRRRTRVRPAGRGRRQLRLRPRQAGPAFAAPGQFQRRALGRLAGAGPAQL